MGKSKIEQKFTFPPFSTKFVFDGRWWMEIEGKRVKASVEDVRLLFDIFKTCQ